MDKDIFGSFIASLRKEAGMTQKQVADILHVTDRAVSKWERGLSYPDVTLMEPLSAVLGVSLEELLTCQRKEASAPESELPALRSVLTITQEEKRIRTRRVRALAWSVIAAALVLTILATMQRNGKLLLEQRTTSPDGSTTFTVYRDSLLGGNLHMKLDHPMCFEGDACPYCGRGTPNWSDRQALDEYMRSAEKLEWSADGRYLLIWGTADGIPAACLELWDFMRYGKDGPVHRDEITLDILQQLSGYDVYWPYLAADKPQPVNLSPQPMLPALPGSGWQPIVTLSEVRWADGVHQIAMIYAYDGTDGLRRSGELLYDVDTGTVLSVKDAAAISN